MSDIKKLLEAMDKFAGQAVGQKPGDQVRGTERATKSDKHPFLKRLVGSQSGTLPKDHEKELMEKWLEFNEDYFKVKETVPTASLGQTSTQNTSPINPADAAGIKQSLAKLKTSVPNLDVTKAATTVAKADVGTTLTPQDQQVISQMAPQLANVIKNPAMAGKLKQVIDQSQQQDLAKQKQQGITK